MYCIARHHRRQLTHANEATDKEREKVKQLEETLEETQQSCREEIGKRGREGEDGVTD